MITATAIGNVPGESYPATAVCTLTVRGVEGNYIYTVEDGGVVIQSYTGEESNISSSRKRLTENRSRNWAK